MGAFDAYIPTVSGEAGSPLDRSRLDFEGRRFLGAALPAGTISQVTGAAAQDPIRVYAGMAHGNTPADRVDAALAELTRLGAPEWRWLVVGAPTGSGWVNHVAMRALELMTGGNCASVAVQWNDTRSVRSRRVRPIGTETIARLLSGVRRTWRDDAGPSLVVFAESMGAWITIDALVAVVEARPAAVGLVGVPGTARLSRHADRFQRLRDHGTRVVLETDEQDPVGHYIGARMALVPSSVAPRRWLPGVSLVRTIRAVDRATQAVPLTVPASAHDYRHRMAAIAARLVGMDADAPETATAISRANDFLLDAERTSSTWHVRWGPAPHVAWNQLTDNSAESHATG